MKAWKPRNRHHETEKDTEKSRKIDKKEFEAEAEDGEGHQAGFRKPRKRETEVEKYAKQNQKNRQNKSSLLCLQSWLREVLGFQAGVPT